MQNIDFIGDIHGHANKLTQLLTKMGYSPYKRGYRHPTRTAIFVGDLIDRGPDNPRVVEIARSMRDEGDALIICGNHEHNAICYNHKINETDYLRSHNQAHKKQHQKTLDQYKNNPDNTHSYQEAINWFKTLPLYLETDDFRVVHASWQQDSIDYLEKHTNGTAILSDNQYDQLQDSNSKLFEAVEHTCKGIELKLPNNLSFQDSDGHTREHIRIKWWLDPKSHNLQQLSVLEDIDLGSSKTEYIETSTPYYHSNQKPVFFGHYWLKASGAPTIHTPNVCCTDYSIAKKGILCAYRYSGEPTLSNEQFVWV